MRIAIIFSYFQTGIIKSKKSPDADSNCDISTGSESPIINISHTKLGIVQDVQANSSNSMLKKGHSSLKRPALYFQEFLVFFCVYSRYLLLGKSRHDILCLAELLENVLKKFEI